MASGPKLPVGKTNLPAVRCPLPAFSTPPLLLSTSVNALADGHKGVLAFAVAAFHFTVEKTGRYCFPPLLGFPSNDFVLFMVLAGTKTADASRDSLPTLMQRQLHLQAYFWQCRRYSTHA